MGGSFPRSGKENDPSGTDAPQREAGRRPQARAYDALIAAVAIARDLPVHTCNPDDLSGIEGLDVVTVPLPQ